MAECHHDLCGVENARVSAPPACVGPRWCVAAPLCTAHGGEVHISHVQGVKGPVMIFPACFLTQEVSSSWAASVIFSAVLQVSVAITVQLNRSGSWEWGGVVGGGSAWSPLSYPVSPVSSWFDYTRGRTAPPPSACTLPSVLDEAADLEFDWRVPRPFEGGAALTTIEIWGLLTKHPGAKNRAEPQFTKHWKLRPCHNQSAAQGNAPRLSQGSGIIRR